jgi:hypothetical protein
LAIGSYLVDEINEIAERCRLVSHISTAWLSLKLAFPRFPVSWLGQPNAPWRGFKY